MAKIENIDANTGEVIDTTPTAQVVALLPAQTLPMAATPMAMIDRALASGASIETLERLMGLQERWQAGEARKAFDGAIANAKSEIGPIEKNRRVLFESQKGKTDYRFEDLAAIAAAVDPVLSKHGLSYRYRTAQANGQLTVTCVLSHRDGYSEETTLSAAYDSSGNKNSIQAVGSAMTYLQRYTLKAALGLSVSHDDDGKASSKPQAAPLPDELTAVQAKRLRDLITASATDEAKFLGVAKAASIEEIAPADFARLEGLLKRKVAEAAKPAPEAEPANA
ncbi:MAG: ERF family protein [Rhodobacteraceae bacterium]|nr:ERF family protein [Paracoccaceae bacterium]MCZ8084989.1 ERF family protein [Paracoccaceae bacterium]